MVQHRLLRLAATLGFIGLLVYTITSLAHPNGGPTYEATFASYAAGANWTAVHLGQFIGMAGLLAGLVVLFYALNLEAGAARWLGVFGALATAVALALAALVYAVDGVALKQAVDAWANAPAAEQAARLASAEAIRWLEWGSNSYQDFAFGLAMLLFGVVIVWTARVPRPIGVLMGLAGLAWLMVGWVVGSLGFGPHAAPMQAGEACLLAWVIWLFIVAWRWKAPVPATLGRPTAASS